MNRRMFFGSVVAATGAVAVKADVAPEPIRDGDVLVVECEGITSQTAFENIRRSMQAVLPNVKVLVVEERMKVRLLRPEAAEALVKDQA